MRTREEWGGGARPRALTRVGEHPYIEVHHDVYPFEWSGVEHARAIEKQHLAQGWNGAFYNLGIASDGELFELRGRGWQSIGSSWHGKKYRDGTLVDKRAMTVVLFGNFEVSQPAQAQLDTLRSLARTVPDSRLRWHGQRDATACCGRHLIAHLPTLMVEKQEDEEVARSMIQPPAGHPLAGSWWVTDGVFKSWVPDPDTYGRLVYLGVKDDNGKPFPTTAPMFDMLVPLYTNHRNDPRQPLGLIDLLTYAQAGRYDGKAPTVDVGALASSLASKLPAPERVDVHALADAVAERVGGGAPGGDPRITALADGLAALADALRR